MHRELVDSHTGGSAYVLCELWRVTFAGWTWFEQRIRLHDGAVLVEEFGVEPVDVVEVAA